VIPVTFTAVNYEYNRSAKSSIVVYYYKVGELIFVSMLASVGI